MDDFAPIAVSTGALTEVRWKTGDLYVYRHRIRCPHCHSWWSFEAAAPRGAIDPGPDPAKLLAGLLCGTCSARRQAVAVMGGGRLGRYWTDAYDRQVYGVCLNARGRMIEITRGELWDRSTPLVDERTDDERRILEVDGRRNPAIGPQRLARLGLDWVAVETEIKEGKG